MPPEAPSPPSSPSPPEHRPERPATSLRRELLAVLFLYAAIAVLPLLVGWGCGPSR